MFRRLRRHQTAPGCQEVGLQPPDICYGLQIGMVQEAHVSTRNNRIIRGQFFLLSQLAKAARSYFCTTQESLVDHHKKKKKILRRYYS